MLAKDILAFLSGPSKPTATWINSEGSTVKKPVRTRILLKRSKEPKPGYIRRRWHGAMWSQRQEKGAVFSKIKCNGLAGTGACHRQNTDALTAGSAEVCIEYLDTCTVR
jgi:hypothetical protein